MNKRGVIWDSIKGIIISVVILVVIILAFYTIDDESILGKVKNTVLGISSAKDELISSYEEIKGLDDEEVRVFDRRDAEELKEFIS